ncbi:hypothetical protein PanWU01x14_308020 [Parasponia andersonii]|uniref:Uncharacterized protein n=1 Tax=Parasponia andersonii TaxID=3476 RepID=A0A2P5AR77_PARAD|nr:hypothetical protein PanWU01x14_308020 [Parasponia andersonii]
MADGIGFEAEFEINLVLILIRNFEALSHTRFRITGRKRRPPRVLLEAITEMPSKSRPLLVNRQSFRAARKEVSSEPLWKKKTNPMIGILTQSTETEDGDDQP